MVKGPPLEPQVISIRKEFLLQEGNAIYSNDVVCFHC